ncbi:MAG: TonB-dependent receptor [Pseudomonadota bacterium]
MYLRRLALASAITLAFPVHAEPEAPAPKAEEKIQKVEVKAAATAYDPRRDDTASKIVVNHEEIVKYGDTSIMDVFKRLPGITVSGAAGRGGGEIRMRGLGAGYTQILINGERAPAGFSLDSLAPDVIERIEILRAASAEYSTQSIAGTINIVLKKVVVKAQRELKLGYGKGGGYYSPDATAQLSDRRDQLSWSLSVSARHNNFARDTPTREDGVDPAGQAKLLRTTRDTDDGRGDSLNLAPRLNWTADGGDTVTWQSYLNINRFDRSAASRVTTLLGDTPLYPAVDSTQASHSSYGRMDLNWVHKLAAGARLELKLGLSEGRNSNDSLRRSTGSTPLDSLIATVSRDSGVTSTGKYATPIVEGHALAMGWDLGRNHRGDERRQHDAPAFDSDETYEANVDRLATYAQDEWSPTSDWSVYLGARWEGIRTVADGSTFASATSRSSVFSPLAQTLWKVPGGKGSQLRFALTRTYKAPSAQSLVPRRFTAVNNSSTEPDYQGNPRLKPELALGFDASYDWYWAEGALLSLSTSARRIDGYTRRTLVQDAGRWVSLPVNDGQAHTRALELEAKFPLKALMADAPNLDLRASLSRNWSRVDSVPGPDNRLAGQTPFSANMGVDFKTGAWMCGASFALRSGGPLRDSATQTSYETVRRDLDAYVLYKFDPQRQLRVSLSNLLARDWVSMSSYADAAGTVHRTTMYPGKINIRAGMEIKF